MMTKGFLALFALAQLALCQEFISIDHSAPPRLFVLERITGTPSLLDINFPNRRFIGMDWRVTNDMIYAVDDNNRIYTVDVITQEVTLVSTASCNMNATVNFFGVDFDPTNGDLHIIRQDGRHWRIDPDSGDCTLVSRTLSYDPNDVNKGKTPRVAAIAYNNNLANATTTTLFGLDYANRLLVEIDGAVLTTIATLDFTTNGTESFDIFGLNSGWAFINEAKPSLHTVNVVSGSSTRVRQLNIVWQDIGFTVVPAGFSAGAPTAGQIETLASGTETSGTETASGTA